MAKDTQREIMRSLPAVDRLLDHPAIRNLSGEIPRSIVVKAIRQTLESLRKRILDGWLPPEEEIELDHIGRQAADLARRLTRPSLRKSINATGVILHTGLGRAVLPESVRKTLEAVVSGHCNLEINQETGGRGSRMSHIRALLSELSGAEDALAVNNNAGAVFLALNTIAAGREVIVSRGQLVEIGGSFRLPDIMAKAGVRLVEVGTTNRTRLSDYESAITEDTALLLRVHTSNYRIVGFTDNVSIGDLVELGRRYGIPVMDDVGSGAFVDMTRFGLAEEPIVADSVTAGADIVTFSGDKLLGGPQAGLVVGRKEIVQAMSRNPISRILRPDKLTVAALESTLRLYQDPDSLCKSVPTLRFIARPIDDIARAARRLRRLLMSRIGDRVQVDILDGRSEIGGGSLPGESLPTKLIAISSERFSPDEIAQSFRMGSPPIFGRVGGERFLLDLRTVSDNELSSIVTVAAGIFSS